MAKYFKVQKAPYLLDGDFVSVKQYTIVHERFDGTLSPPVLRICCHRQPAVVVIPFDPKNQSVVMVEQFRVGAMDQENPWMMELVAGLIEVGEDKEAVARRELQEETGLKAKRLEKIMTCWPSPGYASERITLFWAEVDSKQALSLAGLETEQEDIKVHVLTLKEVFDRLEMGKIRSAPTVLGLQWLKMHAHTLL